MSSFWPIEPRKNAIQVVLNTFPSPKEKVPYMIFENSIIAPLSDIPMFYTVQSAHACWCNKKVIVWFVCVYGKIIHSNHSLHKPYKNLHLNVVIEQATISIRKCVYISVKHWSVCVLERAVFE